MTRDFAETLNKALAEAKPAEGLSRVELQERITDITKQLKGSMSGAERIMLCADRACLRKALDALPKT